MLHSAGLELNNYCAPHLHTHTHLTATDGTGPWCTDPTSAHFFFLSVRGEFVSTVECLLPAADTCVWGHMSVPTWSKRVHPISRWATVWDSLLGAWLGFHHPRKKQSISLPGTHFLQVVTCGAACAPLSKPVIGRHLIVLLWHDFLHGSLSLYESVYYFEK